MTSRNTPIPEQDHVLRYAGWSKLRKDENDNVLGFTYEAIRPRLDQNGDIERSVSITWIEYFPGTFNEQFQQAVDAIRSGGMQTRPKGGFGKALVQDLQRLCHENESVIRVIHEPEEENRGHSGIRRLQRDNIDLLELLAAEAFVDVVLNRDVPE